MLRGPIEVTVCEEFVVSFEEFDKKRKRPTFVKPKYFVKCLDCRAIYSDRVYKKYDTCKFCGGANWLDRDL